MRYFKLMVAFTGILACFVCGGAHGANSESSKKHATVEELLNATSKNQIVHAVDSWMDADGYYQLSILERLTSVLTAKHDTANSPTIELDKDQVVSTWKSRAAWAMSELLRCNENRDKPNWFESADATELDIVAQAFRSGLAVQSKAARDLENMENLRLQYSDATRPGGKLPVGEAVAQVDLLFKSWPPIGASVDELKSILPWISDDFVKRKYIELGYHDGFAGTLFQIEVREERIYTVRRIPGE